MSLYFFRILKCFSPGFLAFFLAGCASSEELARLQSIVSTELYHTHITNASFRQLDSGIQMFLLTETNAHTHTFGLTAEQVALLKLGIAVTANTNIEQAHFHTVLLQKLE